MANKSSCIDMESLLLENDRENVLLSTILKFSLVKGWMTEDEKLRVDSKMTLSEKKSQFFDVLKTMEFEENAIRLLCAIRSMNEVESLYKSNEEDEYERHFSKITMSNLFEESLIAQEKKLPLENITTKQNSLADVNESAKKAMSLVPVIRRVLKYLNLEDIKQCRCVSKEWKSIAEPFLRNRSKIKFSEGYNKFMAPNPNEILFYPSNYFEQFGSTLENMPFTAFKISGVGFLSPWAVYELNDFFLHERGNIRELEIKDLDLVHEDGQNIKTFDITPWIESSPVTRKNTKYHTKLSIGTDCFQSCTLVMQNAILTHIKELSLSNCQVNLQDAEQIHLQPIKLTLSDVSFFRDGQRVPELFINDIVDFSRVKNITLRCSQSELERTKFSLYLNGKDKLHLDSLSLIGITVSNWRECTWTVDKLEMSGNSFVEKTEMQIRELDLSYHEVLDISVLPQSINKLTIDFDKVKRCFSTQNIIMSNLHCLKLTGLNDANFLSISRCIKCPNLIDLDLEAEYRMLYFRYQLEINSDWIPRSVKRVKLCHVVVNWGEGIKDFNLQKLVLSDYSFFSVKKIGNILTRTKELILRCDHNVDHETVLNLLEYLRLRNYSDYLQRIYVGPIHWAYGYSFKMSPLVDYVNMIGEYYEFEKQVGKALDISDDEFQEFENI